MGLYKNKYNPISGSFNLVPTSTIVTFKAAVANAAALPLSGNQVNDGRITSDNGHLYLWDGSTWLDQGDIVDLKWAAIEDKPISSVANIDDAVSKKHSNSLDHTQGTDQGLDTGGANAVTAAQVKGAVTNSHAPHSDDQVIPTALSALSDDATHRLVTDTEKGIWNGKQDSIGFSTQDITDISLNVMLNAFRIAQIGSLTIFNMVKGFMDEYEDENGVDLGNSSGQIYDSTDDFYKNYVDVDAETVLLLQLDNNVTDSELIPKTVTNNNVTFSSSIKKFGTHAASFSGTNSYLSVPDSDDFAFGSGDFTIDTWVRWNVVGNICFYSTYNPPDGTKTLYFLYTGGTVRFMSNDNAGQYVDLTVSWTPTVDTWYHVSLVRNGTGTNCFKVYVNGASLGNMSLVGGSWSASIVDTTNVVRIGSLNGIDAYFHNGYMDEFRVSKGIARWTSSFTPPSTPYAPSVSGDMILQSNAKVATITPINSRIVLFEEDVDSVTLNTDLKAYVSRDNGTTFSQITLEDEGNYITGARILSGVVDISAQPSGTDVVYKITTHNTKKLKIHGTGISWK